jgi:hypothetical protein
VSEHALMDNRSVGTMEAARTELFVRMPTMFTRKWQPYPGIKSCLGDSIGIFNERRWWYATGKAREMFERMMKDVRDQLQVALTDKYRDIVHFELFIIGKDDTFAKPTIMFFCEDREPRKKAKKVLDEGGLMTRMPGFRTGHQARQPPVGRLVRPAENSESSAVPDITAQRKVFYYDPLNSITALGVPIFIKHDNARWRKATGYRVYIGDRCFLMSVSHVFIESMFHNDDTTLDDDSDYDFGSESGSDIVSDVGEKNQERINSIEDGLVRTGMW